VRFAHDVRVQECIVAFLNDDRVPLWVVWAMWAMWAPTLQIYDFSLQILFQEMEIGHL
jgi:predicted DNA-binding protein with PD1-like motif